MGDDRSTKSPTRRIARAAEAVHTLAYYSPEIRGFDDDGFKGWWHAYFAYRSAPMGPVPASVVVATFYNFAPRMIERSVPGCWDIMTPDQVRSRQLELVELAVGRAMGAYPGEQIREAAQLLRRFAAGLPVGARPLYAAWAGEPWPGDDLMDLWHGTTLLREFRFDGHNIALAAAPLDPVECHLMMASHGFGDPATIQKIRGWNHQEWGEASERLQRRGWLDAEGGQSDSGAAARREVERHTDALATPIEHALGPVDAVRLAELLEDMRTFLMSGGEVHGVWPPPTVMD